MTSSTATRPANAPAGKPWSFLHISKPEIDLPPETDPHDPAVYAKGKENFERLLAEGVLKQDSAPCYYLYRLIMGDHQQTGLVAAASVADYDTNRIRKHEFTRPDKEDDRVRQVDALNAQTGPVFLTYKHNAAIDELVAKATAAAPEIDIVADTGVRHSLWVVRDAAATAVSSPAPSTPWIASTSRTATTAPPPRLAWPPRGRPPTRATREKRPTTISCR